jgi:hypothetical protein
LNPFCFGLFGDFIPKGENVGPKQAKWFHSGKNVGPKQAKWFQSGKRQATSEHRKRRSKKGEV